VTALSNRHSYQYDANGNILSISDSLAGPQTQGFQ
jgi:YD repeat-containing protein